MILGNPPYNGFAGMAVEEHFRIRRARDSTTRFFRMADRIISEYAPDGRTSETVMAVHGQSPGIKVGTAITLLSKSDTGSELTDKRILYRDFDEARADERRRALLQSLDSPAIDSGYSPLKPNLGLGLPFKPVAVSDGWHTWPSLPDLFPVAFSGVKTARDGFLVDIDLNRLRARIADYFDPDLGHDEVARRYPIAMQSDPRFDPRSVRASLMSRVDPNKSGFVRYAYRPFDTRWLYWDAETNLLDRARAEYEPHVFKGNLWLSSSHRIRKGEAEPQTAFTRHIASYHLIERVANWFPTYLREDGLGVEVTNGTPRRPNLTATAHSYLERLGAGVEDLFHHALAVLHDPAYREANAGALRMEWPRIPLPGWPDGSGDGAADDLAASAARGRELAALLDPDTPVPGVTEAPLRPEIAAVAVPSIAGGGNMTGDDFALTAGWGHFGQGEAVMPGQGRAIERPRTASEQAALEQAAPTQGRAVERPRTASEQAALEQAAPTLGDTTFVERPRTASEQAAEGETAPSQGHVVERPHTASEQAARGEAAPSQARAVERPRTASEQAALGEAAPSQARAVEPTTTASEKASLGQAAPTLGETTFDIYLNDRAYWRNVPAAVWHYKLGGYQVLKKWLSYREHKVLARPLHPEEVQHFTNTARRIIAILMLTADR